MKFHDTVQNKPHSIKNTRAVQATLLLSCAFSSNASCEEKPNAPQKDPIHHSIKGETIASQKILTVNGHGVRMKKIRVGFLRVPVEVYTGTFYTEKRSQVPDELINQETKLVLKLKRDIAIKSLQQGIESALANFLKRCPEHQSMDINNSKNELFRALAPKRNGVVLQSFQADDTISLTFNGEGLRIEGSNLAPTHIADVQFSKLVLRTFLDTQAEDRELASFASGLLGSQRDVEGKE